MNRLVPTLIGALAAAATLAPAAQASISIGSLAPPDIVCLSLDGQPFTQLQLGLAGGVPFSAPSNGVITSFQVHSGDSRMTELVFKAARPAMPAGHYTIIGQQAAGPQTADAITTTLTRIPVQTGDVIGMSVLGGSCVSSGGMGDSLGTADMEGDIQPGQTNNYADDQQTLLPIAATIEPDADGD